MNKLLSFPHLGDYHIPITFFVNKILGFNVIKAPSITKKTLDIGSKYSPDSVCVPFKYNIGNFIEALESGANVLVQAGGGCRFGYYPEVQEQILRDLGYNFEFISIIPGDKITLFTIYKKLKEINPSLNIIKFLYYTYLTSKIAHILEWANDYVNKNIGFEIVENSFERLFFKLLEDLGQVEDIKQINYVIKKYKKEFGELKVDKPKDCLRVAVVGEVYVAMEPFSNCFVEKQLAKKGVEVTSPITATYILFRKKSVHQQLLDMAGKYLTYAIGADGTDSVAKTKKFAEMGYDGIIHVKPFACIPEVNAMPMLQNISNDYGIPILYLSFDSQTSEAGVNTRIEAFYDMIKMKKAR
jgi:predicted nucleotide-binding protein (sugar kinase/HSP70/actin superfamily)